MPLEWDRSLRPFLPAAQQADPELNKLVKYLRYTTSATGSGPKDLKSHGLTADDARRMRRDAVHFSLAEDGCLLRSLAPELPGDLASVPVLPKNELVPEIFSGSEEERLTWRNWALVTSHRGMTGGHVKLDSTLQRLRAFCWWPTLHQDAAKFIETCPSCSFDRKPPTLAMTRSDHPVIPFDTVQIDLQGPMCPISAEGFRYIFTLICVFTRYPFFRGMRDKTKYATAQCLLAILWELGSFPRVIQSDRGREFVNDVVGELLALLRMKPYTTPAYTPRINGIVERSHQHMAAVLRMLVCELLKLAADKWGEFLPCLQYHLRHHRIADSGSTPFKLVHGWSAALPAQRSLAPWQTTPTTMVHDEWLRSLVLGWKAITSRFAAYLHDYELKLAVQRDRHARWQTYTPGDVVMLEKPHRHGDASKSLLTAMEGPYVVKSMIGDYRAVLKEVSSEELVPRSPAGEQGVATSRLTLVPKSVLNQVRLDEDDTGSTVPVLKDEARRRWSRLTVGSLVAYLNGTTASIGEVRLNFPRRLVMQVARYGLKGTTWSRLYISANGEETFVPTLTESQTEVAYNVLQTSVRLVDGELDAKSKRATDAKKMVFHNHAEPQQDHAEGPPPEQIAAAEASYPVVRAVTVAGEVTDIVPRRMTAEELEDVKNDKIVFELEARDSRRYAEIIAYVAWESAVANTLLGDADRHALVWVCTQNRAALWIDGASYTRVRGATYDVDVGGSPPISQQPYRKSPAEQEKAELHIRKGVAMGLLTRHIGAWSTPAFVVAQAGKPNGRLVCDYRRVNSVTRRMYFPIPRVDDTLRRCCGQKWLSSLDAVSGFNHLCLTPRAKEILAICTFSGLYAWESLPFGPCDGPQAFQMVMRRVYEEYARSWLNIYIDDLCLSSS